MMAGFSFLGELSLQLRVKITTVVKCLNVTFVKGVRTLVRSV